MDFRHLIVTCLFSKLRLPFDNQKVKENYAIFFEKNRAFFKKNRAFFKKVLVFYELDCLLIPIQNSCVFSFKSFILMQDVSSLIIMTDLYPESFSQKKSFRVKEYGLFSSLLSQSLKVRIICHTVTVLIILLKNRLLRCNRQRDGECDR